MARSVAAKAALAADALDAFLRNRAPPLARSAAAEPQAPGGTEAATLARDEPMPRPRTDAAENGTGAISAGDAPSHGTHTDWLLHRFVVAGPESVVEAFGGAAAGSGTIPWQLDLDSLEEDWFHLLANPASRELSLAGARVLAGQLREAVQRRHAIAVSRVGRSQVCPFDLQALVPVPATILRLGPDHPGALAWLWQHWGTAQALRHVALERPGKDAANGKVAAGEAAMWLSFWSADWTPWRAFERIRADWSSLRFDVQPEYGAS